MSTTEMSKHFPAGRTLDTDIAMTTAPFLALHIQAEGTRDCAAKAASPSTKAEEGTHSPASPH